MSHVKNILQAALPKAIKTSIWILKIILPMSLFVTILQYIGVIDYLSDFLTPLFHLLGLPGESAVVFISSIFLQLYAPIAILSTLTLTMRETLILATMCLISHNLPIEVPIQHKTGTKWWAIVAIRIGASIAAAVFLNFILPDSLSETVLQGTEVSSTLPFSSVLLNWLQSSLYLIFKILFIINGLMLLQATLKEFRIVEKISKPFAPFLQILGLSPKSSFLWVVAQVLGITYGGAVLIDEIENHGMPPKAVHLFNTHIAINHSQLEDTALFMSLGLPFIWLSLPRIAIAMAFVWTARGIFYIKSMIEIRKKSVT